MKILAIMSSPRKKDSYGITGKVEAILAKNQNIEFEYLFLSEYKLLQCQGCYTCLQKGEQYCPLKDDRDILLGKMKNADGIVFVTPSYVFQISSNLKIFIERFAFLSMRPVFFGKTALLVVTCSSPGFGLKEPIDYLRLVLFAWGFKNTCDIGVIVPIGYKPSEETRVKNEQLIAGSSNQFYESLINEKEWKPSFNIMMQFKVLKLHAEALKETYTADYEYYKDKNFYVNVKLNPVKKNFSDILGNLIKKKLGRVVKT
jgi:multimeric flavodoxin WrbA